MEYLNLYNKNQSTNLKKQNKDSKLEHIRMRHKWTLIQLGPWPSSSHRPSSCVVSLDIQSKFQSKKQIGLEIVLNSTAMNGLRYCKLATTSFKRLENKMENQTGPQN